MAAREPVGAGGQSFRSGPRAAHRPAGTRLTWPPQVLAPLGQRRADSIVAVAPRAGCAVLSEGVLWAPWLLAVTVLFKVTCILWATAQLTGGRHLPGRAEFTRGTQAPKRTHTCRAGRHALGGPSHPLAWGHSQAGAGGASCSPCTPGSRHPVHTGPRGPAGRWWHCSRGSDSPGGQG